MKDEAPDLRVAHADWRKEEISESGESASIRGTCEKCWCDRPAAELFLWTIPFGRGEMWRCKDRETCQAAREGIGADSGVRIPRLVLEGSDKVIRLTLVEAEALPGFLGPSVSAHLTVVGWRALTLDGVRTLYIRKRDYR